MKFYYDITDFHYELVNETLMHFFVERFGFLTTDLHPFFIWEILTKCFKFELLEQHHDESLWKIHKVITLLLTNRLQR